MNRLVLLTIFLAACGGKSYVKAPLSAPDRQKNNRPVACPMWNGDFVGSKGSRKTLQMYYDANHTLVLHDGNNMIWLIDGKSHYISGNREESYTAVCTAPSTPESTPDLSDTNAGGINVEVWSASSNSKILTVDYVSAGNGFTYSSVRSDGSNADIPDTYSLPPSK